MSHRLVIIPTYNEKENIEAMVHKVFSLPMAFDLLVVDDGSPDGTGQLVKNLQEHYPGQLFLEERTGKNGLGTAYIHGFKWALARDYGYVFEMDADFSHNPDDLLRLYEACSQGADVAVGSRYIKGVNVVNWPLHRILLSYGASFYVKLITGMLVQDPTAGFVGYRREVLAQLDLDRIRFVGYAFQIEMKFKSFVAGFKIVEVPIVFKDRELGHSKMNASIVKEAVLGVLRLKWDQWFHKKKTSQS
ncbi:MAG: polyprenol monophosphomannose synthase [Flavobacteriaceae bacterium]